MANEKRKLDYPLSVLSGMNRIKEAFVTTNHIIKKNEFGLLTLHDSFKDSEFYFKISKADYDANQVGKVAFEVEYYPSTDSGLNTKSFTGDIYKILERFAKWLVRINDYHTVPFFLDSVSGDDAIFEQYKEEYLEEFEILDDDADTHSFPEETQQQIDNYIEIILRRLEVHKEDTPIVSGKYTKLEEIIEDLNGLKETQTSLTKKQVVTKFSEIFAKGRKIGPKVFKDISWEFAKEFIKGGAKFLMENSDEVRKFFES